MKNNPQHQSLISTILPSSARLLMVLIPCIASPLAFAGGQHYQKNPGPPVCLITVTSPTSATASCTGAVAAGLGNQNVRVTLSLAASIQTYCHNPGNGSLVPGQNPATAVGSTQLNFTPDQIKNGSLTLPPISTSVTVSTPDASAAGCPNSSWTVTLGTATFGPGHYSFEQPVGTELPKLSFNFTATF